MASCLTPQRRGRPGDSFTYVAEASSGGGGDERSARSAEAAQASRQDVYLSDSSGIRLFWGTGLSGGYALYV